MPKKNSSNFYPALFDMTDSHSTALMLFHLFEDFRLMGDANKVFKDGDWWIMKTPQDWWDLCRLSEWEIREGYNKLVKLGIIEKKVFQFYENSKSLTRVHVRVKDQKLFRCYVADREMKYF